jgi:hypothetical protein
VTPDNVFRLVTPRPTYSAIEIACHAAQERADVLGHSVALETCDHMALAGFRPGAPPVFYVAAWNRFLRCLRWPVPGGHGGR